MPGAREAAPQVVQQLSACFVAGGNRLPLPEPSPLRVQPLLRLGAW